MPPDTSRVVKMAEKPLITIPNVAPSPAAEDVVSIPDSVMSPPPVPETLKHPAELALSEGAFVPNYEELSEAGSEAPKPVKTLPPTLTLDRDTVHQLIERPNPVASANAAVARQLVMTNHHLISVTEKLGSSDSQSNRGPNDHTLLVKIESHLAAIDKTLKKQEQARERETRDRRALTSSISNLAAAIRAITSAGALLLNQQQLAAPRKEAPSALESTLDEEVLKMAGIADGVWDQTLQENIANQEMRRHPHPNFHSPNDITDPSRGRGRARGRARRKRWHYHGKFRGLPRFT